MLEKKNGLCASRMKLLYKGIAVLCCMAVLCVSETAYGSESVKSGYVPGVTGQNEQLSEENTLTASLNSKAAVLMDGDSGRILYGKNPEEVLPMASTTKVMTLIVALENASVDDIVTVSSYAASMPDVQLGIKEGEQYVLKDLMYSMMLESHNDSAVAIAEYVGGNVAGFAEMMNRKAEQIGCTHTHFITPNGLDSQDEEGEHATTARDLALIMRYAIKNETFLEITRTSYYTFGDIDKKRNFTVNNKNALLSMTNEALTGKTGFTGKAGYCYVCAVRSEGRTFIIALLGCGWPPNKTWKWNDTMALMAYGKDNYELKEVGIEQAKLDTVRITNGSAPEAALECRIQKVRMLLGKHETFEIKSQILTQISAPVYPGDNAGVIEYTVNGYALYRYPVVFKERSEYTDYIFYFQKTFQSIFSM